MVLTDRSKLSIVRAMSPGPEKSFDRDVVLEEAMLLFWERGYEATGISALLERTGIGRQSLYDTFGSKREIFLESLGHYFRTRIGPLMAQLHAPGSPRENLAKTLQLAEKGIMVEDFHGCMIGNATAELTARDPEVQSLIRGYFTAMEDAFTHVLERGQKAGEFAKELDARGLARVFVHTIQGMTLLHKVLRDPEVVRSVIGATLKLLQVA